MPPAAVCLIIMPLKKQVANTCRTMMPLQQALEKSVKSYNLPQWGAPWISNLVQKNPIHDQAEKKMKSHLNHASDWCCPVASWNMRTVTCHAVRSSEKGELEYSCGELSSLDRWPDSPSGKLGSQCGELSGQLALPCGEMGGELGCELWVTTKWGTVKEIRPSPYSCHHWWTGAGTWHCQETETIFHKPTVWPSQRHARRIRSKLTLLRMPYPRLSEDGQEWKVTQHHA